jgi:hypothetical protein
MPAGCVFQLRTSRDQALKLDNLFKIRKQSATAKAEEPKDRTVTVSKLTEWLGFSADGIKVFENTDLNEPRAAETGQGIMGMPAC